MSYSRTQAQSAASRAKTQMGGQSQKSQSGPEARPPDSKFEPVPGLHHHHLDGVDGSRDAARRVRRARRADPILWPAQHGKAFLAS